MIFSSYTFAVFFALLISLYRICPNEKFRQRLLLLASYVFYAAWDYRFLSLILLVTAISFFSALSIDRLRESRGRTILAIAIATQLSTLGVFKYANFFIDSFAELTLLFGMSSNSSSLHIILPVGISFFTFQAISYVMDVYRGNLPCEHRFEKVALYISFFPQLVAGPIVRAAHFLPQLTNDHRLNREDMFTGMQIFMLGFIYKVVAADNIAPIVDLVYADVAAYDNRAIVIATLGFYSQIYFDFAGYSAMAIGIARIFGYRIPINFNFPYLATNVTEFWRRWHISLSQWLRDYLYISLGGNRRGGFFWYRNLMLTMVIGGLWHGANWTFVVWGAIHGSALIAHKTICHWPKALRNPSVPPFIANTVRVVAGFVITQIIVLVAWSIFRAETLSQGLTCVEAIVGVRDLEGARSLPWSTLVFIVPLLVDSAYGYRRSHVQARSGIPNSVYYAGMGGLIALCFACLPLNLKPFVYFQF